MRVTKGTYRIATQEGWREQKGSSVIKFPFIVHRAEGDCLWKVSHLATGYNVVKVSKLKEARQLVEELAEYPIFLMPCLETWNKAKERMQQKQPKKWAQLMTIINRGK